MSPSDFLYPGSRTPGMPSLRSAQPFSCAASAIAVTSCVGCTNPPVAVRSARRNLAREEGGGVEQGPVVADLEVDVRPGGVARRSLQPDQLAGGVDARCGEQHRTVVGGVERRALGVGEVDAGVEVRIEGA